MSNTAGSLLTQCISHEQILQNYQLSSRNGINKLPRRKELQEYTKTTSKYMDIM